MRLKKGNLGAVLETVVNDVELVKDDYSRGALHEDGFNEVCQVPLSVAWNVGHAQV